MTGLYKLTRTTAFRLSMLYFGLFATIAAAATTYIYHQTDKLVTEQLAEAITQEQRSLDLKYRTQGLKGLEQEIAERSLAPGNSLYLLANAEGGYLGGNLKSISADLWNAPGPSVFYYRRIHEGRAEDRFAVATVLHLTNGSRLVIGRDIEDQRDFGERVRSAFLWTMAGILIVGLGGGLLISRQLLIRIESMTETTQSIMAGDLSRRIPLTGNDDEFDRLATSLNVMLTRIGELIAGFREVSDNIAHDLRTPLNRLRNRVEAALREKTDEKGERYREALQTTIEEADELIKTFDALLSIARLEAGAAQNTGERFNLSTVIADLAELYEPVAEEQGIELKPDVDDDVSIIGRRELIAQAVANILDNAIKYSAPACKSGPEAPVKAEITLRLRQREGHADIVIADHGPGIPEADRERVVKRFVRLETSRSQPGTGLGLSLAAAVARIHNGTLTLSDNDPGLKVTLSVRVPAEEASRST
ncbi:MAG TPA: HAMP domain-containing sensor histidine kinase [Hyphomicrobiales bacterium]|nr:HAMP domain-containing sensor histidine kinase [Hyphomicrobiales bacterium]